MNAEAPLPRPGDILSGCRIIESIGAGGMGSVFRAVDEHLGREVAIKIMHPGPDQERARLRFQREAAAIARCNHPGLIRVFTFGTWDSLPYFVMEYVEGRSLKTFISLARMLQEKKHTAEELRELGYRGPNQDLPFFLGDPPLQPLDEPQYADRVAELMIQLLDALEAAHQLGIVHRDLKPSNILIAAGGQPKIVDFGLARHADDVELSRSGQFLGTLLYASPEHFSRGRIAVTHLSDLFSLGLVFFELATLRHPVTAEDEAGVIGQIVQANFPDPRERNHHLSAGVARVILKCLRPEPTDRFQSAHDIREAIRVGTKARSWVGGLKELFFGLFPSSPPPEPTNPLKPPDADNLQTTVSIAPAVGSPASPSPSREIAGVSIDDPGQAKARLMSPGRDNPGHASPGHASPGNVSSEPADRGSPVPVRRAPDAQTQPLLAEARRDLYHRFAYGSAIAGLEQLLDLDPASVDALFLLSFAYYSIGEHQAIRSAWSNLESRNRHLLDERETLKLEIIRELYLDFDYPKGLSHALTLSRRWPEDPDAPFLIAMGRMVQGEWSQAIEAVHELIRRSPEDHIPYILLSECHETCCHYDKAISILEDRIRRFPGIPSLRMKIIALLVFTGQLDDAERHLREIDAIDPANALIHLFRARLQIFRGRFQGAANDLRTAIGLANTDALKGFAYYLLSRICEEEGPVSQAGRYLALARSHEPNAQYMSRAEAAAKTERYDFQGLLNEGADWPWLPFALPVARRIAFDSLHTRSFTHGFSGRTTVWHLDRGGQWQGGTVASYINLESRDQTAEQFVLPQAPSSPFIDGQGNLLRFDCHPIAEPANGVLITVRLNPPLKPSDAGFVAFALGSHPPPADAEGFVKLGLLPESCCASRHHALVLTLPADLPLPECRPEPDECKTEGATTTLLWYRFFFAGERADIRVRFSSDHSMART